MFSWFLFNIFSTWSHDCKTSCQKILFCFIIFLVKLSPKSSILLKNITTVHCNKNIHKIFIIKCRPFHPWAFQRTYKIINIQQFYTFLQNFLSNNLFFFTFLRFDFHQNWKSTLSNVYKKWFLRDRKQVNRWFGLDRIIMFWSRLLCQ